MQLSFCINKIKNLRQFSKNISPNMGLKLCSLVYKLIFAQKYYESFNIRWLDAWVDEKKMNSKTMIFGNF